MSSFLIINERGPKFWDPTIISNKTSYASYKEGKHQILDDVSAQKMLTDLKGKRVLFFIHGFNNTEKDLSSHYQVLENQLCKIKVEISLFERLKCLLWRCMGYSAQEAYASYQPYDVIIGYSWPSYHNESYYFHAKKNAKEVSNKLFTHLSQITNSAKKVDIMAHSMGNYLLFESLLKNSETPVKINHIYSIAPAVHDNTLNENGKYRKIIDRCAKLFIFHSHHDAALNWPYYIAEQGNQALGLLGPNFNKSDHHPKIQVINCSDIVKGHSQYLITDDFYKLIA